MRGLGDRNKRREIFNWLRSKKYSIYLLQEVHCVETTTNSWAAEWGYKAIFSCCSSAKAGVAVLFNNNLTFQIHRLFSDPNGRFIVCDLKIGEKIITLASIYAPNEDDPGFFRDFFGHLSDFQSEELIIGGDFNLVLNLDKDKKGGLAKTHGKSVQIIHEHSANFDLIDPWRILHPDTLKYTWRRKRPEVQCRLDFFLISQNLMCNVTSAEILPGFKTDHSMITLTIALHENIRGPGYWKLNTSSLSEIEYVNIIKSTIQNVKEEYQHDKTVSDSLLWEMIKLKVREKSLKYAAAKNAKISRDSEELEKKINELESLADSFVTDQDSKQEVLRELSLKRMELEKIIEYRTKGAILRSKCRWFNEGEKNTKFFLNLEKRHCKQSVITRLKTDGDTSVTTDKDILNLSESFYKNLYSSQVEKQVSYTDDFWRHVRNENPLSEDEIISCEGELSKEECLQALKAMECNKSPGSDGLPADFYKIFWNDLSDLFMHLKVGNCQSPNDVGSTS